MTIAKKIRKILDVDIDKMCVDWIAEQHKPFTSDDLKQVIKSAIYDAAQMSPEIYEQVIDDITAQLAKGNINKLKRQPFVDKKGNVDWLAFSTMVVNVSQGLYVPVMYASIDAMDMKRLEQRENIDKAIQRNEHYEDVWGQVRDYMIAHNISEPGEAMRRMGVL